MITSLHLGNFKAFAETQRIPIRPLTLIFGANSAGKSSIVHALLYLRHAIETRDLDAHAVSIGGEAVDLGGFRQFVHGAKPERVVQLGFSLDAESLANYLDKRRTESWGSLGQSSDWQRMLSAVGSIGITLSIGMKVDMFGEPLPGSQPRLVSYDISMDTNPQARFARTSDDSLRLLLFDTEHAFGKHFLQAVVSSATSTEVKDVQEEAELRTELDGLITRLTLDGDDVIPRGLSNLSPEQRIPVELAFVQKSDRLERMKQTLADMFPRIIDELLSGIYHYSFHTLSELIYLGPLRSYPARHLAFTREQDGNWNAGGGYAWDILKRKTNVREAVNQWLGSEWLQTPYELKVRDLIPDHLFPQELPPKVYNAFTEAFKSWLQTKSTVDPRQFKEFITSLYEQIVVDDQLQLFDEGPLKEFVESFLDVERSSEKWAQELSQRSPDQLRELVLLDKRSQTAVTHRDVGIGISQVLPVLVYSFANVLKTIAIEQPEIHLHPALQAELGDVFIESALGRQKNTFLIETHSEHIILRILKRIRETSGNRKNGRPDVRPEDVSLLFVGPGKQGSEVLQIRIDERGRLIDRVPGGFFEEDFAELF